MILESRPKWNGLGEIWFRIVVRDTATSEQAFCLSLLATSHYVCGGRVTWQDTRCLENTDPDQEVVSLGREKRGVLEEVVLVAQGFYALLLYLIRN